jgi:hypothetical protein
MDFLMKALLLPILLSTQLIACGGSDNSSILDNEQQAFCLGFSSPSISVSVLDSQTNSLIENARVDVTYLDSTEPSTEAFYETETLTYLRTLSDGDYEFLAVVVSADNYHTHVDKSKALVVDTSCGAKNKLEFKVYLCPPGTACI